MPWQWIVDNESSDTQARTHASARDEPHAFRVRKPEASVLSRASLTPRAHNGMAQLGSPHMASHAVHLSSTRQDEHQAHNTLFVASRRRFACSHKFMHMRREQAQLARHLAPGTRYSIRQSTFGISNSNHDVLIFFSNINSFFLISFGVS